MTYTPKQAQYTMKYAKNNLKRIPLDIPLSDYNRLKTYCNDHGYTINGFIKKLMDR